MNDSVTREMIRRRSNSQSLGFNSEIADERVYRRADLVTDHRKQFGFDLARRLGRRQDRSWRIAVVEIRDIEGPRSY
jgi:hypothetical protein